MTSLSKKTQRIVLERERNRCKKCWRTDSLHFHHVIPFSEGGSSEPENIDPLCEACHLEWHVVSKSTLFTYEHWLHLPCLADLLVFLSAEIPMEVFKTTSAPEYFNALYDFSDYMKRKRLNEKTP